ncbi:MAG: hypothetical protein ACT4NY_13985 [Pseudonocardiales bacterium]
MGRVLVGLDPALGMSPAELAASWDADERARTRAAAEQEAAPSGEFFPGLLELVVLPVAVNLASSVLYGLVKQVIHRARPEQRERCELELLETTTALGDRLLVVRMVKKRSQSSSARARGPRFGS